MKIIRNFVPETLAAFRKVRHCREDKKISNMEEKKIHEPLRFERVESGRPVFSGASGEVSGGVSGEVVRISTYARRHALSDPTVRRRVYSGQLPTVVVDGVYFIVEEGGCDGR